jgi:regulator of sigma E protease
MSLNTFAIVFSTKLLPLAYAIIGFGLLITIHEFGHFIFCKIFNIHTPTFSIGMGPKVLEKKIGNTNFRLSAIPLGGYVEVAGLSEVGQGKQEFSKLKGDTSFKDKPYWQKALVLSGGVIFNLLFAYIIYSILFFVGIPKKKAEFVVANKIEETIQKEFKLMPNDKIVYINNEKLSFEPEKLMPTLNEKIVTPFMENSQAYIKLGISRENKSIDLKIIPSSNKKLNKKFINSFELRSEEIKGQYEKYPFFKAIIKGVQVTNGWIIQMFKGIGYLIKSRSLKGAGGPIMILSKTFETAQKGFIPLLIFLAFISINLAIINILPLGALDGGQLLFTTIEAIIRREVPEIIKMTVNIASWILLLSLIFYLSFKDLVALIYKKGL